MENNVTYFGISKKYFFILFIFSLLSILILNIFLQPFVIPFNSDSEGYLETARYFLGQIESGSIQYPQRLLKPLEPLLAGAVSYIFDFGPAFNFINSLFYFFIGFIIFHIIKLLFNDDRQALIGAILFLTSYPMLQYGIAFMTDLGGWFFFALSVYLTLLFLKRPSYKLIIINGLISAIGFLTKEYVAPAGVFLVICLFLIYKGKLTQKIKYLVVYAVYFLIIFAPWQLFIYLKFHYSYYDWWRLGYFVSSGFHESPIRLIIKSLGATFLLGWIFVFYGLLKFRQVAKENQKIIGILVFSSFSFLLWPTASSRIFYVIGLSLSILASWGLTRFLNSKHRVNYIILLGIVLAGNYFWLIYDDRLRYVIKKLFNVTF
jgi:hypothetical protein